MPSLWMHDTMRAASQAKHANKIIQHEEVQKIMTLPFRSL